MNPNAACKYGRLVMRAIYCNHFAEKCVNLCSVMPLAQPVPGCQDIFFCLEMNAGL